MVKVKSLIIKFGRGTLNVVESILKIILFAKYFELIISEHDLAIPPKIELLRDKGNEPIIKIFLFT